MNDLITFPIIVAITIWIIWIISLVGIRNLDGRICSKYARKPCYYPFTISTVIFAPFALIVVFLDLIINLDDDA